MEKLKIKLVEGGKAPFKKYNSDIGYDLYARECFIENGALCYKLGVQVEPPEGYYVEIIPRSSQSNVEWVLCNSLGVIDPTYRGELQARFRPVGNVFPQIGTVLYGCTVKYSENIPYREFPFKEGERICQMILRKIEYSEVELVDTLSETERNTGGFGSTGKQ